MAANGRRMTTTNFKFDFIGTETRIFDFAEASLNLYRHAYSFVSYVKKATHELIAFITVILTIGLAVAAIPAIILWLTFFSLGLLFSMAIFKYYQATRFSTFDKLGRRELIDLHVKIKHTVRRMELLKSSDFLFKAPILGFLMSSYRADIQALEQALKVKAYPNYDKLPPNPKVHEYNPEDPWQKDTSDLQRYEDLHLN